MVRVLLVVGSSRGGGAAHVRDLALGLDGSRHVVRVVMPDDGGQVSPDALRDAGVPCHALPLDAGPSAQAFRALRGLVAETDILHVHGPRAAMWGRLAALRLGVRRPAVLYTVHALAAPHYAWPRSTALLGMERTLAAGTDRFIAVCEAQREALVAAGITEPERISMVYNGVDTARFAPRDDGGAARRAVRSALGISPEAPLATMVCRLYRPRDFETLLVAFRQLRETLPRARLLIVGEGPDRPRVEELVAGLWLGEQVTLAGQRDDVPEILAASDLLVLATAGWEGLNLSILEAMAAGLPVVASDVGGNREAVVEGVTGRLVPPGSPGALAAALEALLADPAARAAMGAQARSRAVECFSLSRMLADTTAVYERVAMGRG